LFLSEKSGLGNLNNLFSRYQNEVAGSSGGEDASYEVVLIPPVLKKLLDPVS